MLTPSEARSLVSGLHPFNAGQTNWRLAYNFRKDSYTAEARTSLEVIGALNWSTATAAIAAVSPLMYGETYMPPMPHPLKHKFDYNVDAYIYSPTMDNYSILRCAYTDTFEVTISRGIALVGAFCFPKDIAIDVASKLNRGVIVL